MTNSFEQLYLEERKKARMFMTASAILAVISLGLAVYAYHLNNQPQPSSPAAVGGPHGGPAMSGPHGGAGERMLFPDDSVFDYLHPDGSVNTDAITARLNSLHGPPEMIGTMLQARSQQIYEAQESGQITERQAQELMEAWIEIAQSLGLVPSGMRMRSPQ
jgi:hypothetical protein